jgi:two-component system nitrogen regulation sensor histidine kinase NtrY
LPLPPLKSFSGMANNRYNDQKSDKSDGDQRRRRREAILILVILGVVALLTFVETRIISFGANFPISNTILMFSLININLLLLLLLIFLVLRNLVKLLLDRKRMVMGARLRTKLVVAFVALTLIPATVLFFFSINFITSSFEFWFNVPVEQALENSLSVGRQIYHHTEANNQFFIKRIAYQIKTRGLLDVSKKKALSNYVHIVQRSFNLNAVEVYAANLERMVYSVDPSIDPKNITVLSSDNLHNHIVMGGVRSIFDQVENGELVRTVGTVPYGVTRSEAQGFIVITRFMPNELYLSMASISRGVEEYQQIKMLKQPIKITYYITLSIVALLVVFCAIWFGFYLAKSITIPIKEVGEGTRRVAEGDLNFKISPVADDEIGGLVDSFNKMTRDLSYSREQLELFTKTLQEQNVEIEEKRQYMEIVLKHVSAGVISLNAGGFVATINKAAEKMLGIQSKDVVRKSYKKLLKGQLLERAYDTLENLAYSKINALELPLKLNINGQPRSFLVHVNALKDDTGRNMGTVVVFDDLTDLEKAQRMAAWREVARRIAHEVKNPLTPITLSAQRLKRKYSETINEEVFDECARTIIDHVDLIRNLVNEFSAFARFPTANPKFCELLPIIQETVALYSEGFPSITFTINAEDTIPALKLDRQQIKQALINLVDNAVASIKEEGAISFNLSHDPILKMVRIEVIDNGSGISDEMKTHLFEPYFSTKKSGMGLGLTIVNTIVADHNGMISVQDNQPHGAKFVIELAA